MLNTLIVDRMVFRINLKRSRGGNRKKSNINGLALFSHKQELGVFGSPSWHQEKGKCNHKMVFDDEDKKICRGNWSLGAKIDSECQYCPGEMKQFNVWRGIRTCCPGKSPTFFKKWGIVEIHRVMRNRNACRHLLRKIKGLGNIDVEIKSDLA